MGNNIPSATTATWSGGVERGREGLSREGWVIRRRLTISGRRDLEGFLVGPFLLRLRLELEQGVATSGGHDDNEQMSLLLCYWLRDEQTPIGRRRRSVEGAESCDARRRVSRQTRRRCEHETPGSRGCCDARAGDARECVLPAGMSGGHEIDSRRKLAAAVDPLRRRRAFRRIIWANSENVVTRSSSIASRALKQQFFHTRRSLLNSPHPMHTCTVSHTTVFQFASVSLDTSSSTSERSISHEILQFEHEAYRRI